MMEVQVVINGELQLTLKLDFLTEMVCFREEFHKFDQNSTAMLKDATLFVLLKMERKPCGLRRLIIQERKWFLLKLPTRKMKLLICKLAVQKEYGAHTMESTLF